MRILTNTKESRNLLYDKYDEYEKNDFFFQEVERYLSSVFLISQNIPKLQLYDFFNNEDFSLVECYHELDSSRELLKYGFFKQSMISLRIALDIGLYSIYWGIKGVDNEEFQSWLNSKKETPKKDKNFWEIISSNEYIQKYISLSNIKKEIKDIDFDNYVHTKGMFYSNYRNSHLINNNIKKIYNKWFNSIKSVVRIIETLHLLLYPTLNVRYETDYLLNKFGVFEKIPIAGFGFGNEMFVVPSAASESDKNLINSIIKNDEKIVALKKLIDNTPNLEKQELRKIIINEQKNKIKHGTFNNWKEYYRITDDRIDDIMYFEIETWAKENGFFDLF